MRNAVVEFAFYLYEETSSGKEQMTENKPRHDLAPQPTGPEAERGSPDPLPWLIRNLRQKAEEHSKGTRTPDSRDQAQ